MAALPAFTRDRLLAGIHVFRAHDQTELLSIVANLPAFLAQRAAVRLVVLDSVAFHFRQDLQDTAQVSWRRDVSGCKRMSSCLV